MKKVTYNVFYTPVMKFIHKDNSVTQPNLGLFEEFSDAVMARNLMYKIEPVLTEHLGVKLSHHYTTADEKLIPENQKVQYYRTLKEFAKNDNFMQLYAEKVGYDKLIVLVEKIIAEYSYIKNNSL